MKLVFLASCILLLNASLCASHTGRKLLGRQLLCGDEICQVGGSPLFKGTGWQSANPDAKFCLNNEPLDRVTLGHVSWTFLHTTAAYLPEKMNSTHITAFQNLIWTVRDIYACELCRGHFQELMESQALQKELKAVKTRISAVLFVWKIHNMVTTRQHPDRPLFINGITKEFFPAELLHQDQTYTVHDGDKVYSKNKTELFATDALHKYFYKGSTLNIDELDPTFRSELYDGVEKRWRAAGGIVPVASLYAEAKLTSVEKKNWNEMEAAIKSFNISHKGVCKTVKAELKALNTTMQRAYCPSPMAKGPLEVTFMTFGRCPFCAETVTGMRVIMGGYLGKDVNMIDRYIITAETPTPKSLSDFSSLHGPGEVLGDAMELCAQLHYPDQWLPYIWCLDEKYYAVGTTEDDERCANKLGLNATLIKECAFSPTAVRMLQASAELTQKWKVDAGPTIIIDNRKVSVGAEYPADLEAEFCTALACRDLSPELYPNSDVTAASTNMMAADTDLSAKDYLTSLDAKPEDFAPMTAMFSDSKQKLYRNLLDGMLKDGVATPQERKMLAEARLGLGVTKVDHDNAVAMTGVGQSDRQTESGVSAGSAVALLSAVGLVAAVVASVWKHAQTRHHSVVSEGEGTRINVEYQRTDVQCPMTHTI